MPKETQEGYETLAIDPSPHNDAVDDYACRCEGDLMCPACVEKELELERERGYQDGAMDAGNSIETSD